jgi:hypothetical protein
MRGLLKTAPPRACQRAKIIPEQAAFNAQAIPKYKITLGLFVCLCSILSHYNSTPTLFSKFFVFLQHSNY